MLPCGDLLMGVGWREGGLGRMRGSNIVLPMGVGWGEGGLSVVRGSN